MLSDFRKQRPTLIIVQSDNDGTAVGMNRCFTILLLGFFRGVIILFIVLMTVPKTFQERPESVCDPQRVCDAGASPPTSQLIS